MADPLLIALADPNTLERAWLHLNTSMPRAYKQYYRRLLLAYQLAASDNLLHLSKMILGNAYRPTSPVKFDMTTATGLHRRITLLHIDDLILYQAIAEVATSTIYKRRRSVEHVSVYGHIISNDFPESTFFTSKWWHSYQQFLKAARITYESGNTWIAHFDLTAFYDTIDHDQLMNQFSTSSNEEFRHLVGTCLSKWTSENDRMLRHGIPQGPIASNLLSEIYLLPIDFELRRRAIKSIRYSDDFRVFGESKTEVLTASILLESLCKDVGLTPNTKKFRVFEAQNYKDVIGRDASLTEDEQDVLIQDQSKIAETFKNAMVEEPSNKTVLRFISRNHVITDDLISLVIKSISSYPELAEIFADLLGRCFGRLDVAESLFDAALREPGPYSYVEALFWEALGRICEDRPLQLLYAKAAIDRLKQARRLPRLRMALYRFLWHAGFSGVVGWVAREGNALIQAISIEHLYDIHYGHEKFPVFLQQCLSRSSCEPGLVALANVIYDMRLEPYRTIFEASAARNHAVSNTLGVKVDADTIAQIMSSRYKLRGNQRWSELLTTDYEHANQLLYLSEKAFHLDRNSWIAYVDGFNDLVVRKFIYLLNTKKPQIKWPTTIARDGKLVSYGVLLDKSNKLCSNYTVITDELRAVHERRSRAPVAHAFDTATQNPNKHVLGSEQKSMVRRMSQALRALISEVDQIL